MSSLLPLSGAWIASLPANCRCNSASMTHDKPQSFSPPRLSERQLKEPGRRLYSSCHCLAVKILLPEAWQGLVNYTWWQYNYLASVGRRVITENSRRTYTFQHHRQNARSQRVGTIKPLFLLEVKIVALCSRRPVEKFGPRPTSPRSEVLVSGVRQTVTCFFCSSKDSPDSQSLVRAHFCPLPPPPPLALCPASGRQNKEARKWLHFATSPE